MTWEQFGPIGALEQLEMSRSVTDAVEHQRSPRLPASLAKLNFGKALTHRHSSLCSGWMCIEPSIVLPFGSVSWEIDKRDLIKKQK